MMDIVRQGPKNPSRLIFLITALVAITTAIVTGEIRTFIWTTISCAVLLCLFYSVIRRYLPWAPLSDNYLIEITRLIFPA